MAGTEQGWYPDPGGQADLRWWDGQAWTEHTRQQPPAPPVAPMPALVSEPLPPVSSPPTLESTPASTSPLPPPPTAPTAPTGPTASIASVAPVALIGLDPAAPLAPTYRPAVAASPPSSPPTTFDTPAVPPPPGPPGGSGNFTEWSYAGYGATPTPPGTAPVAPETKPDRSTWNWVAVGGAVAVALAIIAFLAVSILGTKSTPSSVGLTGGSGANAGVGGSTTTTPSGSAPTSTAPGGSPTTAAPTGPGAAPTPGAGTTTGTLFVDPTGIYSINVDPTWVTASSANGIKVWTIPSASPDQPYGTVNILSQDLPEPMTLDQYSQLQLATLNKLSTFHVNSTTTITLADGTPAMAVNYTNSLLTGTPLNAVATFTIRGLHAVIVTLTTQPSAPAATVPSATAFINTLHVN